MRPEIFKDWLELPTTQYFFKYLEDSVKEESELVAETVCNGGHMTEEEMRVKATICLTMKQISEINFEEIDEYYHRED